MKTLLTNKSLLLAGGLLFISYNIIHFAVKSHTSVVRSPGVKKEIVAMRTSLDSSAVTLFQELAGKLFPVLKNLNKM